MRGERGEGTGEGGRVRDERCCVRVRDEGEEVREVRCVIRKER